MEKPIMQVLPQKRIMLGVVALVSAYCLMEPSAFADDGMVKICRQLYKEYLTKRPYRAFAATPIVRGRQACGYTYSNRHQMEADWEAFATCKGDKEVVFGREKIRCRIVR